MRPAFFNSNKQHGTATVTCLPKASYMYCIICFPRVMWCHCDIPHCAKAKPYGLAIWRMHALTIQACWPHVRAPQAAHPYPAPESATAQPWSGTAGAQRCEIQTQQKASAVSVGDLLFAPRLTCPPNSHPDTPFFSYPHPLPQCHPTHTLPIITRFTDASMLPPSPVVARRSTPAKSAGHAVSSCCKVTPGDSCRDDVQDCASADTSLCVPWSDRRGDHRKD
jgi:hypothetical protein